ncbi:MAG: RNase adapter RapZ [Magnetococcales bacterium]|nr:RNase adapter RapZ [Magnetococcales bacterium]
MMETSNTIEHLILVTGLSGAGKSSALKYLEDLGFFWVDNLPLSLIPAFLSTLVQNGGERMRRMAIGIHIREQGCLESMASLRQQMSLVAQRVEILFLEADFDRLLTRYRETRRRHPLAMEGTVQEAIAQEAAHLERLRAMADLVIDTSSLTVGELKARLDQLYHLDEASDLRIIIRSFGFKYGSSTDADMVLDGRFLANPHYDPKLRPLTGLDDDVKAFLEKEGEAVEFLDRLGNLFDYLVPRYRREKKRYFTVDIGCTGGRHRSVFLVEGLADRLRTQGYHVLVRHRDVGRCSTEEFER